MRESLPSENDMGFKRFVLSSLRPVVIVGGGGQMGRLFENAHAVGLSGPYSEQQDWPRAGDIVADAGMVITACRFMLLNRS